MRIECSTDPARIDLDAVWNMLRRSYWSPNIRRDIVARAIANSLVVGAYDTDHPAGPRQVGFARAVTDRATFAWLADVIVDEPHRGRGIGTEMVRTLMAHPELQTLRRWSLATRDAHSVYAALGFEPAQPGRYMERKFDPARWSDPAGSVSIPAAAPGPHAKA